MQFSNKRSLKIIPLTYEAIKNTPPVDPKKFIYVILYFFLL